jgi:hypothetical protein
MLWLQQLETGKSKMKDLWPMDELTTMKIERMEITGTNKEQDNLTFYILISEILLTF